MDDKEAEILVDQMFLNEALMDKFLVRLCERSESFAERFKAVRLGSIRLDVKHLNETVNSLDRQKLRGVTTPEVERIVGNRIVANNEYYNGLLKGRFGEMEQRVTELEKETHDNVVN